jgi:hypothetical protein
LPMTGSHVAGASTDALSVMTLIDGLSTNQLDL